MSADFLQFAAACRPQINHGLARLLQTEKKAVHASSQPYYEVLKHLGMLTGRGGKRLRPLLFLATYEGYGGTRKSAALRVALSQELLHTFLLIHDDIIDRDFDRWGGPNLLGYYFERYSKTMVARDALHFAEAQALLGGDACLALSNQQLLSSGFDPASVVEAALLQQQIVQQVVNGEVTETALAQAATLPTEAEVLHIYRSKTASYSFQLPLQLGALLAGAGVAETAKLATLADALGIAFQLQDDILGTFGDEAVTGKSNMSDLREGRRTLLIVKALELASAEARIQLRAVLGNKAATSKELQVAKTAIVDSGARDYVQHLAADYLQQAAAALDATDLSPHAKELLQDFIGLLSNREK
jgi:geranylgeranyl pyrophosphate synthase